MPTYRLHDHAGDDLGLHEHPAPNLEPGDVVVFVEGREAVVQVIEFPNGEATLHATVDFDNGRGRLMVFEHIQVVDDRTRRSKYGYQAMSMESPCSGTTVTRPAILRCPSTSTKAPTMTDAFLADAKRCTK